MLNADQQQRIARKCTSALSRAIDSLPKLLEDADAEAAAEVVADLIKSCLSQTLPEPDPGASLAEIVRMARLKAELRNRERALDERESSLPNS